MRLLKLLRTRKLRKMVREEKYVINALATIAEAVIKL